MPNNIINELKDVFQDCHINFLIGAGLSSPYLSMLGNIEQLLTDFLEKKEKENINKDQEILIKATLYKRAFNEIISKNINILPYCSKGNLSEFLENYNENPYIKQDQVKLIKSKSVQENFGAVISNDTENPEEILKNYQEFIKIINTIILNRKNSILNRQINIFTTNFDIFLETTMEKLKIEYNDGFNGRFNPEFNLSNFKKSIFKRSLHYDNSYELPVFNLIKIHGSLTWIKNIEKENIFFDKNLLFIKKIKKILNNRLEDIACDDFIKSISNDNKLINIMDINSKKDSENLNIENLINDFRGKKPDMSVKKFIEEYEKISIINPTKEKFKETVLNRNYYELLRIYASELEKENTALFVMGFSFSDEHIREVTVRASNSNPTLKIYIFSYDEKAENHINKEIQKSNPNNENIQIINFKNIGKIIENKEKKLDFKNINNNIFNKLLRSINEK